MKNHVIKFKESKMIHHAIGRNGLMKCQGLSINVYDDSDMITILPINSKGNVGNCLIDIPRKDLKKLLKLFSLMAI